jgi:hypothetical protein
MNTKFTAKDFFLHLGAIVSFYASVIALITLLFEVINFAYPKITNAYAYYLPSISFQVATLVVAFPLFLLLSWMLQKTYFADPSLREAPLRRWLAYITLFIAGAVIAGDLVTVVYMFLDGQELTAGFLLKVLALLVIAGGVFVYYLREIRNLINNRERNIWRGVSILLIIVSIALGFAVIGSPATQRALRYDIQRTNDLQNIQWQVINYWQLKEVLPSTLVDLNDSLKPGVVPTDPVTKEPYTYERTGNLSFKLCANFDRETRKGIPITGGGITRPIGGLGGVYYDMPYPQNENWEHPAGTHCFERTIDPELYPKIVR